ncbi:MAG: hypothetical protein COV47_06135 [Candidatus Diapherotrites archaeon CG11_big_fil_rev_8_21_14_0_20_37_9]|nr:MAG: hypothetical protein COV47_06135 [Candidatus Diapherotrites archaeon CG11_big_fil_rev_8_21_14_0_20_37_9]
MAKDKGEKKDKKAAEKKQATKPKTKRKTTDKWKKKAWYTIIAPAEFERTELGHTIVEKPENLVNRVILISGRELANQPKKQHFILKFKITDVTASKANTESIGHEIKESYLKRTVRRRASKVAIVSNFNSKDNKNWKIQIIAITDRKASRTQKTAIRRLMTEAAKKYFGEIDSAKIVDSIVFGQVSNKIYTDAKKIVPLKRLEITKSAIQIGK